MNVELIISNQSARKRLYRRDVLTRIAERLCADEGLTGAIELSVLFCDDAFIQNLNKQYRDMDRPTDVLSFSQDGPELGGRRILGDIVISLETVESRCADIASPADRDAAMRDEVRLLFCHGVLHLLGYDHATAEGRARMTARQAHALGIPADAAWPAPVEGARRRG